MWSLRVLVVALITLVRVEADKSWQKSLKFPRIIGHNAESHDDDNNTRDFTNPFDVGKQISRQIQQWSEDFSSFNKDLVQATDKIAISFMDAAANLTETLPGPDQVTKAFFDETSKVFLRVNETLGKLAYTRPTALIQFSNKLDLDTLQHLIRSEKQSLEAGLQYHFIYCNPKPEKETREDTNVLSDVFDGQKYTILTDRLMQSSLASLFPSVSKLSLASFTPLLSQSDYLLLSFLSLKEHLSRSVSTAAQSTLTLSDTMPQQLWIMDAAVRWRGELTDMFRKLDDKLLSTDVLGFGHDARTSFGQLDRRYMKNDFQLLFERVFGQGKNSAKHAQKDLSNLQNILDHANLLPHVQKYSLKFFRTMTQRGADLDVTKSLVQNALIQHYLKQTAENTPPANVLSSLLESENLLMYDAAVKVMKQGLIHDGLDESKVLKDRSQLLQSTRIMIDARDEDSSGFEFRV